MEQNDICQRGRGRGIMVGRRGRDQFKNIYEWSMDMDNGGGTDCGSNGIGSVEEGKGGKIGTTVIE